MRYRAKNDSCRGEKCAQYTEFSVAASQSLKEEVVKHTDALQVSISSWIRKLIEDELRRKNNAR